MQKKKTQHIDGDDLRCQAEEIVGAKAAEPYRIHSKAEIRRLDHELEVQQIELEMQNTELIQSRDVVETALEKYTDLYDFAPVGYCSLDSNGIIRAANITASNLVGKERSELIGQHFRQLVSPESRMLIPSFLERVFASQGNESCEVKLAKTGVTPCYVRIEGRIFGSKRECRIAVLDVSGRKRDEEKYHQTRSRLAWVLEKTNIGMWLNELPLDLLTVDDQTKRLLFFDTDIELTLELFWSRIHPDDRSMTQSAIKNAIRNRTLYDIEHRILEPASGQLRWCRSTGQATYADDGTPLRFDGLMYDISKRKRAEEMLQEAHDDLELRVNKRTKALNDAYEEIKLMKDQLKAENIYLQQEIAREHNFGEIIGQCSAISYVFFRVDQVAPMNATVLLLGETGTGKGVIARAIHSRSARKDRPMVTVNCSSLPANLIESELFGRERGAFTGADARQVGRFELADGGTIFLDEIGEMPIDLQPKLLRVIQDGEFERLGSPKTIKVNVRIIAASNRNLEEEIVKGKFRKDLFYRLNVFPIMIPPLRQRKEDIPLLVHHFVSKFNKKIGKKIVIVPNETLRSLEEYQWPGNVRELESVIERSVIISQGATLQVLDRLDTVCTVEEPSGRDVKAIAELERDHILQVLTKTGWRIEGNNGAAIILGLNASTLRARMRKHGITRQ